jgi:hypothetical protein
LRRISCFFQVEQKTFLSIETKNYNLMLLNNCFYNSNNIVVQKMYVQYLLLSFWQSFW